MSDPLHRVPVTIVTGFLGSGKTTLLNHVLGSGRFGRVAALVNDFGQVNIDGALVAAVADEVMQLTNGCVCCNINGDLLAAAERALALMPPVDRIVVETSGLADPLPVGLTFLQTELASTTVLDPVVTVVDCANFALDLFRSDAAMAQIVHGDVIVLNKVDLAAAEQVASLERRIAVIKPRARTLRAVEGRIPLALLLDPPVRADSLVESERARGRRGHLIEDGFVAEVVAIERPLSSSRFQAWLDERVPSGVFRAKGLLRLDRADRAFVFQLCGARASFHPYSGSADRSEIVFIGRGLDRQAIVESLRACVEPDGRLTTATT